MGKALRQVMLTSSVNHKNKAQIHCRVLILWKTNINCRKRTKNEIYGIGVRTRTR